MSGNGPLIQPPTTRIGGGGSAHAVTIGVVVVLLALVWVGWSGRPAGPSAGAPALPSVAAPTAIGAGPTSEVAEPTPGMLPTEPVKTIRPSNTLADDVYLVTAGFAGAEDGGMLREVAPDHLRALMHLPSALPYGLLAIQLHQLSSVGMPTGYVELGSWEVSTDALVGTPEVPIVLQDEMGARSEDPNPSLLVRRGFRLEVRAEDQGSIVELVVDIRLLPKTRRPADEDHRIFPFIR